MTFTLKRTEFLETGIFGILEDKDEKPVAVTLEHSFGCMPKLATGTYNCVRYNSPKHDYQVFVIEDTPDFKGKPVTYLEIHIGNFNSDSDGCILLGSHRNGDMIMDSQKTFYSFMDLTKDVDSFTLIVDE